MAKQHKDKHLSARRQASADMWEMLTAFVTTPDMAQMHYVNDSGEIYVVRAYGETGRKIIGFATQAIGTDDDDNDRYAGDIDDSIAHIIEHLKR